MSYGNEQRKKTGRLPAKGEKIPEEKRKKMENRNSSEEVTETKEEQKQEWDIAVPILPRKDLKHGYVVKYKKNAEIKEELRKVKY